MKFGVGGHNATQGRGVQTWSREQRQGVVWSKLDHSGTFLVGFATVNPINVTSCYIYFVESN